MRTRLEIVSKLVEDKHITFEEGMMLMEKEKGFNPLPWTINSPITNPCIQPYYYGTGGAPNTILTHN